MRKSFFMICERAEADDLAPDCLRIDNRLSKNDNIDRLTTGLHFE